MASPFIVISRLMQNQSQNRKKNLAMEVGAWAGAMEVIVGMADMMGAVTGADVVDVVGMDESRDESPIRPY